MDYYLGWIQQHTASKSYRKNKPYGATLSEKRGLQHLKSTGLFHFKPSYFGLAIGPQFFVGFS